MFKQSPEYTLCELPTINLLKQLGWQHIQGDTENPALTERNTFKQVLLTPRLKTAIKQINPHLEDHQINTTITTLENITAPSLIEINQKITHLLQIGTTILDKDGKNQTIHYIDFQNPQRNDFLVINQYRVDPPGITGNKGYCIPDIVLFVNGIPLVVIECKSPTLNEPLTQAIGDLLKYSNQRNHNQPEGIEKLFYYNLLMIAASGHQAVAGTIGASYSDYLQWLDTTPHPPEQLNPREKLIAGMLTPSNLLDILYNFTLFDSNRGKLTKIIPRYLQYRAVTKATQRLLSNPTNSQRGGIIWHTQGSGKSLTMVYLVRKMRTIPTLRRFKIVIVTDRKDLEKQLRDSAFLTGEPLQVARNVQQLERLLTETGAGLIFGMIQKFRSDSTTQELPKISIQKNLNLSEYILVLIDEAHRSHSNTLHTNLLAALPNCTRIGFTGTPIVKGKKKTTRQIFGTFIDKYTIRQSQQDGVTLPILYEGLETRAKIAQQEDLDRLFSIIFQDKTESELTQIRQKYVNKNQILEAKEIILAKATDMLRHFITHILPGGFKAQVVASSRSAAIAYYHAFNEAKQKLIQQLKNTAPILKDIDFETIPTLDPQTQFLATAYPHLDTISRLEFAPVISADKQDPPDWQQWTVETKQQVHIERFKKPLSQDGLAFLIVKNMLLTGFDAPIEQVLYLDRSIAEHELLQAIARVNRTYPNKTYGLVVDYYGVDIAAALAMYDEKEIESALVDITQELPKLKNQHQNLLNFFHHYNCTINDLENCVNLLKEEKLRVEFTNYLKDFLNTLDIILPRPEALPYIKDAKLLGLIRKLVADLYRDEKLNLVEALEKVRALIDQYIISQGIDLKVGPIDILSVDFKNYLQRYRTAKTQATVMEQAARYEINIKYNSDPIYYQTLSQQLEEILQSLSDNHEAKVEALKQYVQQIQTGKLTDNTGLDPFTERPFLSLLEKYSNTPLTELIQATKEIIKHIRAETKRVNFWQNTIAQADLQSWLVQYLDNNNLIPFEQQEQIADDLMQLAKHKYIN